MDVISLRRFLFRRLLRHLRLRIGLLDKMKRGTCEFCGEEDVEIDLEHVIPRWLSRAILERMSSPRLQISRGHEIVHQSSGPISVLNIEARCTCKLKCNNDWMHKLEDRVIPFMRDMVTQSRVTHLNTDRQILLTGWTVKTAMTHEFYGPHQSTFFTRDERKHLKTYLLPPIDETFVWLARNESSRQGSSYPIKLDLKEPSLLNAEVLYALTLSLGDLIVQLLVYRRRYWKSSQRLRIHTAPFHDRVIQLWPRTTSQIVVWPPPLGITDDELDLFTKRFFDVPIVDGVTFRTH